MHSLGFMAPILPGQIDRARRVIKDIAGPRQKEMADSRLAKGVTRESTWLQSSPMGDILLVYLEGEDIVQANREFATSRSPFDVWMKQELKTATGLDYNEPIPFNLFEALIETPIVEHKPALEVALPVAPGKTDQLKQWAQDQNGARREDFQDFLRRAGIARACVYLAHTPQGDIALQYSESDDPAATYRYFATSQNPYDQRNREQLSAIHGVDFNQPLPGLPERGYDFQSKDLSKVMRKTTTPGRRPEQGVGASQM